MRFKSNFSNQFYDSYISPISPEDPANSPLLTEARQRKTLEEQQFSQPCQHSASPNQSGSSTPLAPGLRGTPPVSCQMTCMPSALRGNRNLEPFCTCRVLGTVGTQQLTAPWRGAKPSGTPSPTPQAAGQLSARRQLRLHCCVFQGPIWS